jgi:hypothetical protein
MCAHFGCPPAGTALPLEPPSHVHGPPAPQVTRPFCIGFANCMAAVAYLCRQRQLPKPRLLSQMISIVPGLEKGYAAQPAARSQATSYCCAWPLLPSLQLPQPFSATWSAQDSRRAAPLPPPHTHTHTSPACTAAPPSCTWRRAAPPSTLWTLCWRGRRRSTRPWGTAPLPRCLAAAPRSRAACTIGWHTQAAAGAEAAEVAGLRRVETASRRTANAVPHTIACPLLSLFPAGRGQRGGPAGAAQLQQRRCAPAADALPSHRPQPGGDLNGASTVASSL